MKPISHDFQDESMEAKVRWFRDRPISERIDILFEYMDLALELNPALVEKKDAQPVE